MAMINDVWELYQAYSAEYTKRTGDGLCRLVIYDDESGQIESKSRWLMDWQNLHEAGAVIKAATEKLQEQPQ